ncbi:hypothetical protein [Spiroplasma endosymbiont of Polydrusus pterygomalis]|uniref:hypothetical protein n=1 Tax=Spiroplasma endosymbiont of Polydrusus pterygomalis TaxID=3139327 RepID=UPI003CCAD968
MKKNGIPIEIVYNNQFWFSNLIKKFEINNNKENKIENKGTAIIIKLENMKIQYKIQTNKCLVLFFIFTPLIWF